MPNTHYSRDWLDRNRRRLGTLYARYGTIPAPAEAPASAPATKPVNRLRHMPRGTTPASIRRAAAMMHQATVDANAAMPIAWEENTKRLNAVTDTVATLVTLDLSLSNVHTVTLASDRTIAVENVTVGQCFAIRLLQNEDGNHAVTWFTTIRWAEGGSPPDITTTPGKASMLGFFCSAAGQFDAFIVGLDI